MVWLDVSEARCDQVAAYVDAQVADCSVPELEGWTLFTWVTTLTSCAVVFLSTPVDLSTGSGTVAILIAMTVTSFGAPRPFKAGRGQ